MSHHETFSQKVPNFSGGRELTLDVAERDGRIAIGLSMGEQSLRCLMDVDDAEQMIAGLAEAVSRAKANGGT